MADVTDLQLDLTTPGFYLRPDYFDVLADLRRRAPVTRTLDGSWAVTRYEDIRAVSRDPERFVSGRGVLINDPMRSDGSGGLNTFSILHLDPPVHAVYRKVVNRQFTPRAVAHLEESIRATVTQVLDAIVPDEPVDGVGALASLVPIAVIAELFGVGGADRDMFRRWSDAIIAAPDAAETPTAATDFGQMADFLMAHIDSPATDGNDLLDILKSTELEGRPLSRLEIMGFCMTLLVAGNETTRTLISGGMEALCAVPDQRAALAADLDRVPTAVEELLRWVTPIQAFGRTAVVDTQLGGEELSAGDFVIMLYASGNRDEAAFGPTAAQLDVGRPVAPPHVAFGFGEHLCLGAALARLEARVFFEVLLDRYPTYELAGEVEYVRSTLVRGAARMPLVLAP
jgi:cytochrome P450